jgi:hypothetical protein
MNKNIKLKLISFVSLFIGMAAIIFMLAPFAFNNQIIYGGGVSIQHFPVMALYQKHLLQGIFPFYTFDFGLGFDSLADSQQSLLHPIKIVIALYAPNSHSIDTLFLLVHIVFIFILLWFWSSRLFTSNFVYEKYKLELALFISFPIVLSTAFYTNFVHIYYIPVIFYGLLIMLFIDNAIQNLNRRNLLGITASTLLMLLCGNFTMQWIILGWVVTYLLVLTYKLKIKLNFLYTILLAISFGFLLAAPQLLPTFDLMLATSRTTLGGGERFAMSTGPFQWFAYLTPGATLFAYEHANYVYGFAVGNNVIDGLHYVGILPLIAFFCCWEKQKKNAMIAVLAITLLFVIQRSLGIFSPINIFLNYLPIFGQFRASVRYLFLIDITICLMSAMYLQFYFERKRFLSAVKLTLRLVIILTIFIFVLSTVEFYFRYRIFPSIGWFELYYLVIPIIVLASTCFILNKSNFSKRTIILILFIITLLELSAHRYGLPTHWQAPKTSQINTITSSLDELCEKFSERHVILLRPEGWDNSWYRFDLPIFPNRYTEHNLYPTKDTQPDLEPNGYSCTLTHTLSSSTLTPKSTIVLEKWLNSLSWLDRLPLFPFLGFNHVISFNIEKAVSLLTKNRQLEMSILQPGEIDNNQMKKLVLFLNEQDKQKKSAFNIFLPSVYKIFEKINLLDYLPSTTRTAKLIPEIGWVIALQEPYSYVLKVNDDQILPIKTIGNFLILPISSPAEVKVQFVPVAFLLGILVSGLSFLTAVILICSFRRKNKENINELSRYHQIITYVSNSLFLSIRSIILERKIYITLSSLILITIIALFILLIYLKKIHIILQITSLIMLIYIVYKIIDFMSGDKVIAKGLSMVILLSHILGIVLIGVYNYQKNVIN